MGNNNNRGAITVYLSIILSAVILLSGVLMDIVRIKTAEVHLRRAVNTAAFSALANYNTKLKESYGLFALNNNDAIYLKDDIEYYLTNQLYTQAEDKQHQDRNNLSWIYMDNDFKNVSFIDIYNYNVESIMVTPLYNYTENEITRHQIIEYMKYRAPVQFAENFMEKIDYAASVEKDTSAYKLKTAIDKKLGAIEKSIIKLQKHINEINKFNIQEFDCSSNANSQLMTLCRSFILREIYNDCRGISVEGLKEAEKDKAKAVIEQMEELYQDALYQIETTNALLEDQITQCLNGVYEARQEIENMTQLSKVVRQDIESLKVYLKELDEQNNTRDAKNLKLAEAMEEDIKKYEKLLDTDSTKGLVSQLNNNLAILNYLMTNISGLSSWVASESGEICASALKNLEASLYNSERLDIIDQVQFNSLMSKLSTNSRLKQIEEATGRYEIIPNIIAQSNDSKSKDPRKSTEEAAKKIREEVVGGAANSKTIKDEKLLPSYYINGSYPNKIFSEDILAQAMISDESKIVEGFDVNFDKDSDFADKGFDYIISFAKGLKEKALNFRDEIYVNEYILKIFKDVVELEASNTDGKNSSTYFDKGEVEYILAGNKSESINKYLIRGQIFLIRFGVNTLHVYSDARKRFQTLEVATAAAGFTGFGIPIVHNLIMCAWGAAEAYGDVQDIYDGNKVPFIKTSRNWRTNLVADGFKTNQNQENENGEMDFDYHDYLRLLLLVQNSNTKMNRIEDLIQLNIQQSNPEFRLSSCNTYIKVDAQVSIRYWFITKLFVPSKHKTVNGRHIIDVEVWRGY